MAILQFGGGEIIIRLFGWLGYTGRHHKTGVIIAAEADLCYV